MPCLSFSALYTASVRICSFLDGHCRLYMSDQLLLAVHPRRRIYCLSRILGWLGCGSERMRSGVSAMCWTLLPRASCFHFMRPLRTTPVRFAEFLTETDRSRIVQAPGSPRCTGAWPRMGMWAYSDADWDWVWTMSCVICGSRILHLRARAKIECYSMPLSQGS